MTNSFNFQFDSFVPNYESVGGNGEEEREEIMGKTLQEYQMHLAAKHRKRHTWLTYYNAAKRFLEFIGYDYSKIDKSHVQGYVAEINKKCKNSTINGYIQGLDIFLDYLGCHNLRMPIPRMRDIHRDTIAIHQIKQVYDYVKKNHSIQDYLIFLFIRDMDCRPHEITKAEWSWIKDNKISFQDCKTGDTEGYFTNETLEILERHRKETPLKDERYIFVNQRGSYKGQKLSDNTWAVRSLIKRVTKKVVGRSLNPQDLRASIITEEYNHYVNPKVIQSKARHRDQKTTLKYNHIDVRQTQEYITQGTIFTPNHANKRSYINILPQDIDKETNEEDNRSFSFSISFDFDSTSFLNHGGEPFFNPSFKDNPLFLSSFLAPLLTFPHFIEGGCINASN